MSNLQMIAELCSICELQAKIIKAQAGALAEVGAWCMEEEQAEARERFSLLLGAEEWE